MGKKGVPSFHYTAEDIATMKIMREEGKTWNQIAFKLHRSVTGCMLKYNQIMKQKPIPVYATNRTVTIKEKDIKGHLENFTFDEILSYLRDNGFRIVDNKFVRYIPIEFDFNSIRS